MNIQSIKRLKPQFVINEDGKKMNVILSIENFNELLEDIEDLAIIATRKNEPTISSNQLLKKLKKDGIL